MTNETLTRIGDNPIQELMDLDEFYEWSLRIARLESILFPRKGLTAFQIFVIFLILLVSGMLIAAGVLAFIYG